MIHRHNVTRVVEVHTTDLAKSADTELAESVTKEFVGGVKEVITTSRIARKDRTVT